MVTEQCTDSTTGGVTADFVLGSVSNKFLVKSSSVIANDSDLKLPQKLYLKDFSDIHRNIENIKNNEIPVVNENVINSPDHSTNSEEYLKKIAKWLPLLVLVVAFGIIVFMTSVIFVFWKFPPVYKEVIKADHKTNTGFPQTQFSPERNTKLAVRTRSVNRRPNTCNMEEPENGNPTVYQLFIIQDHVKKLKRNISEMLDNKGLGQWSSIITRFLLSNDKIHDRGPMVNQQYMSRMPYTTREKDEYVFDSRLIVSSRFDILRGFDTMGTCQNVDSISWKQYWVCHLLVALEGLKKDLKTLPFRVFDRLQPTDYETLQSETSVFSDLLKIFQAQFEIERLIISTKKFQSSDPGVTNSVYNTVTFSVELKCLPKVGLHMMPRFEDVSISTISLSEDASLVQDDNVDECESEKENLSYIFTPVRTTFPPSYIQATKMTEDDQDKTGAATNFTQDFTSLSMQGDSSQRPAKKAVKGRGTGHQDDSSGTTLQGLMDILFVSVMWVVTAAVTSSCHLTDCTMSLYILITCVSTLTMEICYIIKRIFTHGFNLTMHFGFWLVLTLLLAILYLFGELPLHIRRLKFCQYLEEVMGKILKTAANQVHLRTVGQLSLFAMIPEYSKSPQDNQDTHSEEDSGNELDSISIGQNIDQPQSGSMSAGNVQMEDFSRPETSCFQNGPDTTASACGGLPKLEVIQADPDVTSHVERKHRLAFDELRRVERSPSNASVDSLAVQEDIKLFKTSTLYDTEFQGFPDKNHRASALTNFDSDQLSNSANCQVSLVPDDSLEGGELNRFKHDSSEMSVIVFQQKNMVESSLFNGKAQALYSNSNETEQTPISANCSVDVCGQHSEHAESLIQNLSPALNHAINNDLTFHKIDNDDPSNMDEELSNTVGFILVGNQIADKKSKQMEEQFLQNSSYCYIKSDVHPEERSKRRSEFRDNTRIKKQCIDGVRVLQSKINKKQNSKGLETDGRHLESEESEDDSSEEHVHQTGTTADQRSQNQERKHIQSPVLCPLTKEWAFPDLPRDIVSEMSTCFCLESGHSGLVACDQYDQHDQDNKAEEINNTPVLPSGEFERQSGYQDDDKGRQDPTDVAKIQCCLYHMQGSSHSDNATNEYGIISSEKPIILSEERHTSRVRFHSEVTTASRFLKLPKASKPVDPDATIFQQNNPCRQEGSAVIQADRIEKQNIQWSNILTPLIQVPGIPLIQVPGTDSSSSSFIPDLFPFHHDTSDESLHHEGSSPLQFQTSFEREDISVPPSLNEYIDERLFMDRFHPTNCKQKYSWQFRSYIMGPCSKMMNFLLGIESAIHGSGVFLSEVLFNHACLNSQFSPLNIDGNTLHYWTIPQHSDQHRDMCMDLRSDIIYFDQKINLQRFLNIRRKYEIYIASQQDASRKLKIYGVTKSISEGCHFVHILYEYRKVVATIPVFITHTASCCGGLNTCRMFKVPKGSKVKEVLLRPEVEALVTKILVELPHLKNNMFVKLQVCGCSWYPSSATRLNCSCMLQVVDSFKLPWLPNQFPV